MASARVNVKVHFDVLLFFRFIVKIQRNNTLTACQRLVLQPVSGDNVMGQKSSGSLGYVHIEQRAQCIEVYEA
jgi:hypothetical protein